MADLLLGIDVGTSAVKAGVFEPAGRLLGLGRRAHAVSSPRPGWAECDPEVWWRGTLGALGDACREAGVGAADVGAIGVGVLFPCVVPLDEDGRALDPAILYCDGRSLAQVRAIEEAIGREAYQATIGNMLVPGTCAATSIAWLRDERPEVYRRAATFGFANTFLTGRLTGRLRADPSMAGLSGLMDIRDPWHWSGELAEAVGVDAARLPPLAGSADLVGHVTANASRQSGLAEGTPVVCGGGDVLASAVGGGAGSAETCVYIAGSTDCAALPMPAPTPDRRWANTAYVERGTWLGIGATTSTGASVEWFVREFLSEAGASGLARMTELAARAEPGAGGTLFLPYLQGERTPVWDPLARGAFVGLSSATTLADLARAVLEGGAFAVRQAFECAGGVLLEPSTEVRMVGGPASNALWNQIKAAVLGRRLDLLGGQETGALGAALLAGLGAGVYGSFEEAIGVARSAGEVSTVEPDAGMAARYAALADAYARLYPATREVSHALARLA
jgi:xylulokinase